MNKKEHKKPWQEKDGDAIMGLSLTVNVKGGSDEQILFYQCLKKWLVAMVASWLDPKVVNHEMLVLIGEQGSYKNTKQLVYAVFRRTGTYGHATKDGIITT